MEIVLLTPEGRQQGIYIFLVKKKTKLYMENTHICRSNPVLSHTGNTKWDYFESNIDVTDWGTRSQMRRIKCHL